jgi:hypothetical protein
VIHEGLSDMTSFVTEYTDLHDKHGYFEESKKEAIWDYLLERNNERSLLGCSVAGVKGAVNKEVKNADGERSGIITGHAYGINDIFELDADRIHKLLRVRNPWGARIIKEWNGKWSDQSQEQEIYKKELKEYNSQLPIEERFEVGDDGEFLINFANFRDIYNNLFAARDFPD